MLGTGAADGWPNPWCGCDSCEWARSVGEIRTPTSVLVDNRLLIDCGPEAPRQALRAGTDLTEVRTVLISHVHSDHFDPAFLLHRSWVSDEPLTLIGPAPVIAESRDWLKPGQTAVTLREVTAGDRFEVDGYRISVLPARHPALGESVLYVVDDGEKSLLYACDTGRWADAFLDLIDGEYFDAVIMEQTFGDREHLAGDRHLGFGAFAANLDDLRDVHVIDSETRVIAAHLSHHNPIDVEQRMNELGAEVVYDGIRLCY
jgi:phosphoribosyl 1,2-cyclic phosphodiesterase